MYINSSFRYIFKCIPFVIVNIVLLHAGISVDQFYMILFLSASIYLIALFLSIKDTYTHFKEEREILRYGTLYQGEVQQLLAIDYEYAMGRFGNSLRTGYRIECAVTDCIGNIRYFYSDLLPRYWKHKIPKNVQVYRYIGSTYITWDKDAKGIDHAVTKIREKKGRKDRRLLLQLLNEMYYVGLIGILVYILMDRLGYLDI